MCSKRVRIDDDDDAGSDSGDGTSHLCHAKLPPETWSEVWSLLVSLEDRIAILLVCTEWRAVALADHQLWAHLSVHLEWLLTYDIDEDERERLSIEEKTAAARWLWNAERALDRTGRCTPLTLDIRIDHHDVEGSWLDQLWELLNSHASHIARLWLHLDNWIAMNSVLADLESPMPMLRVLGLTLSRGMIDADGVRFELCPNLKEFAGRPCGFLDFKPSESSPLETIRTVRGDVETCADLTALLRTFPAYKYLDLRISYAYKWEDPDDEDTDYYRSCFEGVDRLALTWGWNSYAKTGAATPTTRRPPFIFIGLHEYLDSDASEPEEEVCMGIQDAFCDLKPHSPITLRLEPCAAWGYHHTRPHLKRDRKPICVTIHDRESGQTRQVAIHYLMLYERPGPMKVLGARLSGSRVLITSLTVTWDLMGMLMRQLVLPAVLPADSEDGLRSITQLTLIVTRLLASTKEEEEENLKYWPALPALRHVTLKTPYCDPTRLGGGSKLSPTLFRSAVERLVPPPAKLETLSLHHVGTGYRQLHWNWNSVQDLATRVYGLHIYTEELSTEHI